jgi:hypothetical protein
MSMSMTAIAAEQTDESCSGMTAPGRKQTITPTRFLMWSDFSTSPAALSDRIAPGDRDAGTWVHTPAATPHSIPI